MNYLTYLNIHHFKSIGELEIRDLSNINIIVGTNNSGKTSLLEAISILGNEDSVKSILNNVSRRSSTYPSNLESFLEIFPREQDIDKSVKIKSTIKGLTRELTINGNIVSDIEIKDEQDKTFLGNINVKLGYYNGKLIRVTPEYEDCKKIAKNVNLPLNSIVNQLNSIINKKFNLNLLT